MAATALSDIIVPEVFSDYVTVRTAELSALYQSGVASSDPVIAARAAGGGGLVNLPYFNDLTGDDEVASDTGELTLNAITASDDVAVKLFRAKAWSSTDLVRQLAGADPIQSLANRVADYWNRKHQKALFSTLTGVFTGPLASTHVLDVSDYTTGSALSANVILDGKQLLGDSGESIVAVAVHSAKYTQLQKENLVQYLPVSDINIKFPFYLGYRVIIDDGCPAVTAFQSGTSGPTYTKYTSYLFAEGAVADVECPQPNAIELARYATKNQDVLISRSSYIMHARGVKWNSTDLNPSNADLATGSKWTQVYENKQIRIVAVVTK
jgi:hypothetical protein